MSFKEKVHIKLRDLKTAFFTLPALVTSRRGFESAIVSAGSGGSFEISNGTINWRGWLITTVLFSFVW